MNADKEKQIREILKDCFDAGLQYEAKRSTNERMGITPSELVNDSMKELAALLPETPVTDTDKGLALLTFDNFSDAYEAKCRQCKHLKLYTYNSEEDGDREGRSRCNVDMRPDNPCHYLPKPTPRKGYGETPVTDTEPTPKTETWDDELVEISDSKICKWFGHASFDQVRGNLKRVVKKATKEQLVADKRVINCDGCNRIEPTSVTDTDGLVDEDLVAPPECYSHNINYQAVWIEATVQQKAACDEVQEIERIQMTEYFNEVKDEAVAAAVKEHRQIIDWLLQYVPQLVKEKAKARIADTPDESHRDLEK